MAKFQKGVSGNPGGRPKLPAEMREMFQTKAPEAFEVLCRHLNAKDPRVAVAAATRILDRAYGRPPQTIDANINEDSSVRFYAEVPRLASTTEEWLARHSTLRRLSTSTSTTMRDRVPAVQGAITRKALKAYPQRFFVIYADFFGWVAECVPSQSTSQAPRSWRP